MPQPIHIIGGGLAGSEAAWQIAQAGVPVVLHEMRPDARHRGAQDGRAGRAGLLQLVPLRRCRDQCRRPAARGDAPRRLADHGGGRRPQAAGRRRAGRRPRPFLGRGHAARSTSIRSITIERGEVAGLPPRRVGQRHHRHRAADLAGAVGRRSSSSPARASWPSSMPSRRSCIWSSIDEAITWRQSRYDKAGPGGTGADYINCPMTKAEYEAFIDALLAAEKTSFKEWEASTPYFDGCLPIEVMAERGRETLRFGPMKPVGLTNPHTPGERPYAVVQLRQDNALGTLWNMVGFQTKLKHGEQARVFRTDPGPRQRRVRAAGRPASQHVPQLAQAARWRVASAAPSRGCALPARSRAARATSRARPSACWPAARRRRERLGERGLPPPPTTAFGALLGHITGGHISADGEGGARPVLPAHERQLRPVPAARCALARRAAASKIKGKERGAARKRALSRPRARRSRPLAGGASPRRGGIVSVYA